MDLNEAFTLFLEESNIRGEKVEAERDAETEGTGWTTIGNLTIQAQLVQAHRHNLTRFLVWVLRCDVGYAPNCKQNPAAQQTFLRPSRYIWSQVAILFDYDIYVKRVEAGD